MVAYTSIEYNINMGVTPEPDARTNAEYLRPGEDPDLILYCKGHAFKLHYSIIRPRSAVMGDINNKDPNWLNTISKPFAMDLRHEDFHVVKAVVDYLYTSDYYDGVPPYSQNTHAKPRPSLDKAWDPRLSLNSRVYCFARRYEISALPQLALGKFLSAADQFPRPQEHVLGGQYLPSQTFMQDVMDTCWPIERLRKVKDRTIDAFLKDIVFDLKELEGLEEWHKELCSTCTSDGSALEIILRNAPEILRKGAERGRALEEM
ncbi:NFX1-type zinc finger-containing 1 protein [Rutstroemia sp. NJR-2017a BVV2]|nr:NFX1-type zinc finger-containing 1 protein [Rutstroemia sp. NJR-2017a BVV2]